MTKIQEAGEEKQVILKPITYRINTTTIFHLIMKLKS